MPKTASGDAAAEEWSCQLTGKKTLQLRQNEEEILKPSQKICCSTFLILTVFELFFDCLTCLI